MVIISVKQNVGFNFSASIRELFRVWIEIDKNQDDAIVLELSECRFAAPNFLLGLHLLFRQCLRQGYDITLKTDTCGHAFKSYLQTTYFSEGFDVTDEAKNHLKELWEHYRNRTYLPIISFPTGELQAHHLIRATLLQFLSESIQRQLHLTPQIQSEVAYLIDEAINNISDHARTDKGYVFTQFYPRMACMESVLPTLASRF